MDTLPRRSEIRKPYRVSGKFYGQLNNETFFRPNAILYRELEGYGADLWLILDLEKCGCQSLVFADKLDGNTYQISLADFRRHAEEVEHPGWNPQLCCPRRFWNVVEGIPRQLSLGAL